MIAEECEWKNKGSVTHCTVRTPAVNWLGSEEEVTSLPQTLELRICQVLHPRKPPSPSLIDNPPAGIPEPSDVTDTIASRYNEGIIGGPP